MSAIRIPKPLWVLLAWVASSLSAQDGVVFHSDVSLIRVEAEVVDGRGAVLTELKKDDFRVLDQGAEVPLVSLSFEEEPLDVILLFDTSSSMRGKLLRVVRAVELGFHELRKGDRACVMAFGPGAVELAPFTSNFDVVNDAILLRVLGQKFAGESNLEQAADDAAIRFRSEPRTQRRRAVLAVSDRYPGSAARAGAVIRDLWQTDAVFSELVIGRAGNTQVREAGANILGDKTGGATVVAGDPGEAFQQALRLLRRRYTLYYAFPGGQGAAERSIEVRLSPEAARRFPGARVRARTGYLSPR